MRTYRQLTLFEDRDDILARRLRQHRTCLLAATIVLVSSLLATGTTGLLTQSASALAGDIATVAGNGTSGHSGDGGPATSAAMRYPHGVAVDSSGNLFITNVSFSHRVRKVDATGTISTVAGTGTAGYSGDGGPASSAQFNEPKDVAADSAGNLYIADRWNHRIRKVNATGTITTVAGTGTAGYSGDGGPATSANLQEPSGVAVDSAGNLYIADTQNDRIRKVNATGTITTVAGSTSAGGYSGDGGPATSAKLAAPLGVEVDSAGNLYIADAANDRVCCTVG